MIIKCLSNLAKANTKGKCYKVVKETGDFITINIDNQPKKIAKCYEGKFFVIIKK